MSEARFERRLPMPILVLGGVVFGIAAAISVFTRLMRRGQTFDEVLPVAVTVIALVLVVLGLVFVWAARSGRSEIDRVAALVPGSMVFLTIKTVEMTDFFTSSSIAIPHVRWRYTVAVTDQGLELRRPGIDAPFAVITWGIIDSIEPGRGSQKHAASVRAIEVSVTWKERRSPLTFPVHSPRNPLGFPIAEANETLDAMRARWLAAQRAGRSHTPASGGRVSSTDAGRSPQGSSDATTEP